MTRRLKVFHVITKLEFGGAQQNTLFTVSKLDRERYDVRLVSGPGGLLDKDAPADTIFVASLARPVRPGSDLRALWALLRLFRAERPDIVHTHSSKAGILARLAARAAGVPVVIHSFHGFGFHERQPWLLRRAYVAAERLCGRLSDALVFVSKANMETARSLGLGRPSRYRLIRSGVDLSRFPAPVEDRGRVKAAAGVGMHKPLVLSVGNLKPQKNPEDFVRLAAKLRERAPEARFLFIGDGELRPRVEALLLKEALHGKCVFPGWRRDAPELMAAADVFVLTSLWEGLPRSLVEAMRSGLPCVCYDADGVRDLLRDGENGFLVPARDLERLAARVEDLLADPDLRKRLGSKARETIGPEFEIEGMVRAQERLYEELSGEGPPAASSDAETLARRR